jgi:hypothetical protein
MLGNQFTQYPPLPTEETKEFGLLPIDFVLETAILNGLDWFRNEPGAKNKVFGHLRDPWLADRYGQAKIDEVHAFIVKYQIKVVQHFALIDMEVPCISIALMDGSEMVERAGMADFQQTIDVLDAENMVKGRTEVGYIPVLDNIQLGIHSINTPDLVKYIYYLLIYILSSFKVEMELKGIHLGTFRATDLSRMNEFLPENMYSRFINFTSFSLASYDKGSVPIITKVTGVSFPPSTLGGGTTGGGVSSDEVTDIQFGLRLNDIEQRS